VVFMKRPDTCLTKTDVVSEERLFLAATTLLEEIANRIEKASKKFASQATSGSIE
jgi:hypothetical protein